MYSLKLPTPSEIHTDMMQLADMNKSISPQGYYQLVCESHILLRNNIRHWMWSQPMSEQVAKMQENYSETCWLLASYHVLGDDWKPSLPYFRMSGRPVSTILLHCKELWSGEGDIPRGLVHFIREVVIRPTLAENNLAATLADAIIDLLGTHSLDTLSFLILRSPGFREFKASKMLAYFKKDLEREGAVITSEKLLAFALLSLNQGGDEEELRKLLTHSESNGVSLSNLLIQHNHFLIDAGYDSGGFSELSMLLQICLPNLFADVVVSLVICGVFRLDDCLKHFLGSFVSASSLGGGGGGSDSGKSAAMLQLFLETYFTKAFCSVAPPFQPSILQASEREAEQQALLTLVRSYLSGLSSPVRLSDNLSVNTVSAFSDLFDARLPCLDRLPPFNLSEDKTKAIGEDEDSSEFWYKASLFKLQSLLSSSTLGSETCKSTVLNFLDMFPASAGNGEISLKLLCATDLSVSLPLLCKHHPGAILPYVRDVGPISHDHWRLVLQCLQHDLASDETSHELLHEAWYSAMQEVLDHLAQTLGLEAFVQVLPGPESSEEFQGYIQMCRKNQQAADIQSLIVTTGNKLLSTLAL